VTVNSQAYELACAWFRQWRDYHDGSDPLPWLRYSPLSAKAGEEFIQHILRQGAMLDPVNRLWLIAAAREGSTDAQKVLGDIIIHCDGRGIALPHDLMTYDAEVHAGLIRPHSAPGPRRKGKLLRDQFIAMGVELLVERFGPAADVQGGARMAGTNDHTTPITLLAARDLVVETLLSPPWAEQLIIKWLYQRRVGWQYEMVKGQPAPGRTLEQEAEALWAQPTRVLVDWQESYACRVTVYRKDTGCLKPACRVTVIGIRVVRENIERELAQMPSALLESVAAGNQSRPPPRPAPSPSSSETPRASLLPVQEASARQASTACDPAWPSAEQLGIVKATKQKTILRKWSDLCRRYPNIYNADKVRAGEVSGRRLAQQVGDIDPGSARTFLRALRGWLEQQS